MMKVFLCYRSSDDAYAAALLDDKLSAVIGRSNVFRASRSVNAGESYVETITAALHSCETVLVVIGPTWREHIDKIRNLSSRDDWVRFEIATALRLGKRVIPILLSRTPRLVPLDLPGDISELAYKQYLSFEHRNVDTDVARLLEALGLSASTVGRDRPRKGGQAQFVVRKEAGRDGTMEIDIVRRGGDGVIMGRLSGRVHPFDLVRMAALMISPVAPDSDDGEASILDRANSGRAADRPSDSDFLEVGGPTDRRCCGGEETEFVGIRD